MVHCQSIPYLDPTAVTARITPDTVTGVQLQLEYTSGKRTSKGTGTVVSTKFTEFPTENCEECSIVLSALFHLPQKILFNTLIVRTLTYPVSGSFFEAATSIQATLVAKRNILCIGVAAMLDSNTLRKRNDLTQRPSAVLRQRSAWLHR